jgi:hypothetical protein
MVMMGRKHDQQNGSPGRHAFLVPVAWIVGLLASYWLVADWQSVPVLLSEALAAIR